VRQSPPDPFAAEQTWPSPEELAAAEKGTKACLLFAIVIFIVCIEGDFMFWFPRSFACSHVEGSKEMKLVPKGTSPYQAAWIPDLPNMQQEGEEDSSEESDQGQAQGIANALDGDMENDEKPKVQRQSF
jgi:pre-rRNA-processing protein TSR1